MKKLILLIFLFLFALNISCAQKKITTFVLVRHAEKGTEDKQDPDLKPLGLERADRLMKMLEKTPVDGIYATSFKRTRNTVAPLAKAKGLDIQVYEAFKVDEIENMLKKHAGGTVVISGHSNNIPWIANLLTGKEEYKDFDESDYGNLLVVSVVEKGKVAQVTWLRY